MQQLALHQLKVTLVAGLYKNAWFTVQLGITGGSPRTYNAIFIIFMLTYLV